MKVIGYYKSLPADDEESLVDLELPRPSPGPRDILVKVEAVSVNPVDTKVRANAAPPEGSPRILGFDAAGTVEEVGAEVMLFKKGDQVFYAGAIDRPGSNSEFQLVDERIAARKPESLSFAEAAALPLTSITAWELLFDRLRVPYGIKTQNDALLIINGAGGVGSILTQLARRLTGLTVIATASRPETAAWCQSMGAHHVINHHNPLDRELKEIGIPQVRYVASLTGTEQHLPAIIELLEPLGAMAVIDDPATLDIKPFKSKGLSVHWEYMFARPVYQTADMIEQHRLLSEVAALVDAGVLKTTMREELGPINAANLRRAHGKQESGRSIGKNVLASF
ncbi:zinc-binding alcohol dehydrogenase family protein [Microbulbifer rhizosphaerae]|uniref:Zinc-type alcohol dehydrogenase-like protein n=1 Tax=Microbulbifer rhizosphaerae TaxID=1562603 RepID=A0A7W4ZAG6_9GAMM|nr:zinc-binding alcohol dehydrogenase family protein [Microbulbifer rhizosphaerae]MBB3062546.1 zinc-binding alcohol dehydrogenase family protein [Microbulbifer rhizosphaerae]